MEHSHNDPQKQQELEQHEVTEVLGFLKRYGKMIGAGIAAAAIVSIGSTGYRHHQVSRTVAAEQALRQAQTPEDMEEVISRYRTTPVAPTALLELAKFRFNNGETAQARAQYERFLKEYKKDELRPSAELGLAYCAEADGDFGGAAQAFRAFAETHTDHWLRPVALLGLARCTKEAGRTDEARIMLEDFLTENAGSRWAGSAENALKELTKAQ